MKNMIEKLIIVLYLLISAGISIGAIYVVVHFISKYW